MRRVCLLLLGFLLLLSSCATSKLLTNGISYRDIPKIEVVNPFIKIGYIAKGNRAVYNKALSDSAKSIILQNLETLLKDKKLILTMIDTTVERKYYQELSNVIRYIDKTRDIGNIRISADMDSILLSKNVDYAMAIIEDGFSRLRKNYINQSILLAFAGYYPIKAACNIRILIIDRANRTVVFHRKAIQDGIEPLNSEEVMKELSMIFDGYI